jgi:hypothetical protein
MNPLANIQAGIRQNMDSVNILFVMKIIPKKGDYHSYAEIVRWLEDIERFYPQMAQTFNIGNTHEGRQIRGIKAKMGKKIN